MIRAILSKCRMAPPMLIVLWLCAGCGSNDTYSPTVKTTGGGSGTPDFTITATPATRTINSGQATTYMVTITGINEFYNTVSLSASGFPAGAAVAFAPASVTPDPNGVPSVLTVTTSGATPTGTFTLRITAVGGGRTHSVSVNLIVSSGTPDFTVSAAPPIRTVTAGQSAAYTVTVKAVNGFSGTVTFTATGLPAGATATFVPPTLTPTAAGVTSALTVSTKPSTPTGTFTITITETGRLLTHSATVQLVVNAAVANLSGIYIGDTSNSRVVRIDDMSGTNWTTFSGVGVNNISGPRGVFVDASHIYIADNSRSRIVRIDDMTGRNFTAFGSPGSGVNQFNLIYGIFVDSASRIYICDWKNHRIVRVNDMTGAGWVAFGTLGSGVGQFQQPTGVAVDSAGRIYIADLVNSRIVRIDDMTGTNWTSFGTFGSGVGQFSFPTNLFVDTSDRVYVSDTSNHRIVRIDDMAGTNWTAFGTDGTGVGQFGQPQGIFVDGAGRIYVMDARPSNSHVVRMDDMTGRNWTAFGSFGMGVNQFIGSTGVFAR